MIPTPSRTGKTLLRRWYSVAMLLFVLYTPASVVAQEDTDVASVQSLKNLSIEELMNIEVTLVSRSPEKLTEVASAVQVITRKDILRSGATNLPEALRLVTNLQVAQLNSNAWIISARGFNTIFANKLLVMIDGRTVYTPLFGGVLWELQNVLLEDVERIEVVSGPGGTLWGVNAVNGVINVVTRSSGESQGTYVSVGMGNVLDRMAAARHGGRLGQDASYRVYGQHIKRDATLLPEGDENSDAWWVSQAGFRVDWEPTAKDAYVFQGDFYAGNKKTIPEESPFDGQNIMARWTHSVSDKSNYAAQVYIDRYWREAGAGTLADQMQTLDFDFQHRVQHGKHDLLWGANYRNVNDHVVNASTQVSLLPPRKNLDLIGGFVQDAIALGDKTTFTIGTKVSHNVYTGIEVRPSARLSFALTENNFLWMAVSRAVRTPSRLDVDYYLPAYPVPPTQPSVAGGPNFTSEMLIAYEAGYRVQPNESSTVSISGFYNTYDDVYSVEALPGTFTYQIQNGSEGESWGGEFMGTFQPSDQWRIRLGYTYLDKDLRSKPGRVFDPSYLGNDARNQVLLQSILSLPRGFQFDVVARYLDFLPKTLATAEVPEYFTVDARLAWEVRYFEFSLVGQNLWEKEHIEFGTLSMPRGYYGRITCRF